MVTNFAIGNQQQTWIAYVLTGFLIACVLIQANGSPRLLQVASSVTLLISTAYLGLVVREIRLNQDVKAVVDGWSQEADLTRARAGIQ